MIDIKKWLNNSLIAIVLSVLSSVIVNYLFFTTSGQVWKQAAVENIQTAGKLQEVQINYRNEVTKLLEDFNSIRYTNTQVDSILTKHGI